MKRHRSEGRAEWAVKKTRIAVYAILSFIVLAAGIISFGTSYYQSYAKRYRAEAGRNLLAIADLKVGELARWRQERLGDGEVLYNNPVFSRLVRLLFEHPEDTAVRQQLVAWLGKVQCFSHYERVLLIDTQAVERLSIPEKDCPISDLSEHLKEVFRSGKVTFMGFHRHAPGQPIVLGVLVPVFDEAGTNRPLGVLVLQIDPAHYLYPFIQRWPVPSETAETLLVRREGDEILFLNELRFQSNTALNLRYPLTQTDLPAVKAVLGQRGLVRGLDYRNAPVLAALKAVPDSPWFMVARQDIAEIYAPVKARLRQTFIMTVILLFGAAAGIGLVWRHQRVRFYRQKAEMAEVLESERRLFSGLIENSPDYIYFKDRQGRFLRINQALSKMFKLQNPAEAVGKTDFDFFGEVHARQAQVDEQRIITTGEPIIGKEEREDWPGGERVSWASSTKMPMYDPSGRITGIMGISRDITAHKQAEQQILRNQSRLNGLVNILQSRAETMQEFLDQALGEALRVTDSQFGYIYFYDEKTEKFTLNTWSKGVMAECAVVNPQICYALDKTGFWGEAVRQRKPVLLNDFQSSHPLKKGYPQGHVELTRFATIPVFKANQIVAVVGVANKTSDYDQADIFQLTLLMNTVWKSVEIRQAQEELYEATAILKTAMEQSPAGIAIAEAPSGRLSYVNKAGLEIGGGNDRDLVGGVGVEEYVARWNLLDLDGSPLPVDQIPIVRAIQSGEPASREFMIRRGENDDRTVLAKAAPIKNGQGKITSAIVVFLDITENKETLRKLSETMEHLKNSNRDLEQFAYIASHDLQEPLRMVANYMQLLERRYKDKLDQDAKDFIGYAVDGAVRMQALIDSLLDYSRLQTRRKPFEPVDLNKTFERVLRDLEGRILETGAKITADPLPQIRGDGVQLGLVFQNFITNALKFRGEAPPEVHISAREFSTHWKITVRDNGIGIDPDHQERIFKIFQRLHSRAEYPGTGIGLAICRRIIERHGGETGVESELRKGSVFWFTLPKKGENSHGHLQSD